MSTEVLLGLACLVGALAWLAWRRAALETGRRRALREFRASRAVAEADLERFAEELLALESEGADFAGDAVFVGEAAAAREKLELARSVLESAVGAPDVERVAAMVEAGRYAACCARARLNHASPPAHRAPCFFNPSHGPSECDVTWQLRGRKRRLPACAADAERVASGAQPNIRTVARRGARVPYWEGGRGYAHWAQGYFANWSDSEELLVS